MWADNPDVEAVAEALWLRMRDVVLAERRLERFTFAPEAADAGGPERLAALAQDAAALSALARDVTLRALAAASDPVSLLILRGRDGQALAMAEMAARVGLPELAVGERVNVLAQAGLATRDQERDAVVPTAAGVGLAALVDALAAGLADRLRRELPALLAS